jgi:2-iminobutanoate/2-iminopropanoate deaminase
MATDLKDLLFAEGGNPAASPGERAEIDALGLWAGPAPRAESSRVPRRAVRAPDVLNEAYHYTRPVSFSRGLRVEMGTHDLLFISGTASIDENGRSIHAGDFRAQCWRTYRNISRLLAAEGATWHDVVRCTCYLRDIERDYRDFNDVRTTFFTWLRLDPLPASVGVQARLCREELLVEIEALAVLRMDPA